MARYNVSSLAIKIDANAAGVKAGALDAQRHLSGFSRSVDSFAAQQRSSLDGIGRAIKRLAIAYAGFRAFDLSKEFVFDSVRLATELESATIQFETLTGSVEVAKTVLDDLRAFAAKTPFQLAGLRQAAGQLLAFGTEVRLLQPTLRALGDLASATGANLGELAAAYSKMQAGKIGLDDVNKFLDRGINLVAEFAKQFGVSEKAIYSMVSAGQIEFRHVQRAIADLTAEGQKFSGGMERASQTIAGRWSTVNDTIAEIKTEVGGQLVPITERLVGHMETLTTAIKNSRLEAGGLVRSFNFLDRQLSNIIDGWAAQMDGMSVAQRLMANEISEFAGRTVAGVLSIDMDTSGAETLAEALNKSGAETAAAAGDIRAAAEKMQAASASFKATQTDDLLADLFKFGESVSKSLQTPLEKFRDDAKRLFQARAVGDLSPDLLERGLRREVERLQELAAGMNATDAQTADVAKAIKSLEQLRDDAIEDLNAKTNGNLKAIVELLRGTLEPEVPDFGDLAPPPQKIDEAQAALNADFQREIEAARSEADRIAQAAAEETRAAAQALQDAAAAMQKVGTARIEVGDQPEQIRQAQRDFAAAIQQAKQATGNRSTGTVIEQAADAQTTDTELRRLFADYLAGGRRLAEDRARPAADELLRRFAAGLDRDLVRRPTVDETITDVSRTFTGPDASAVAAIGESIRAAMQEVSAQRRGIDAQRLADGVAGDRLFSTTTRNEFDQHTESIREFGDSVSNVVNEVDRSTEILQEFDQSKAFTSTFDHSRDTDTANDFSRDLHREFTTAAETLNQFAGSVTETARTINQSRAAITNTDASDTRNELDLSRQFSRNVSSTASMIRQMGDTIANATNSTDASRETINRTDARRSIATANDFSRSLTTAVDQSRETLQRFAGDVRNVSQSIDQTRQTMTNQAGDVANAIDNSHAANTTSNAFDLSRVVNDTRETIHRTAKEFAGAISNVTSTTDASRETVQQFGDSIARTINQIDQSRSIDNTTTTIAPQPQPATQPITTPSIDPLLQSMRQETRRQNETDRQAASDRRELIKAMAKLDKSIKRLKLNVEVAEVTA